MKTSARLACVVVLALLALVGTVPVSQAKGPTDVAVSGPGVDTRLGYRHASGDVDLGTLAEAARMYDALGTMRPARAPGLGPAELGPRYTLEWTAGGTRLLVQHAYPFAEGGAWVRFLPAESGWGSGATGWVRTPALAEQLVALGAAADTPPPALAQPTPSVTPSVTAADASGRTPADQDDAWPSYRVAVLAGVLLAGAVVAGVMVARRRLLSR